MEAIAVSYIAVFISGAGFVYLIGKDIFGAGNSIATKFAKFKEDVTTDIANYRLQLENKLALIEKAQMQQRLDFSQSINEATSLQRVGFDAIKASIHELREGLLKHRGDMAEMYMRRDSYYKAADEIKAALKEQKDDLKKDMAEKFQAVQKSIDEVAQSVEANRRANK